jgi:hypothetical protein
MTDDDRQLRRLLLSDEMQREVRELRERIANPDGARGGGCIFGAFIIAMWVGLAALLVAASLK